MSSVSGSGITWDSNNNLGLLNRTPFVVVNPIKRTWQGSRKEVHASQQVFKPRVRAKVIELRVDPKGNHIPGPARIRLLEPGESLILVAQPGVDGGDGIRRYVATTGPGEQLIQRLARLGAPA